MRSSIWLACVIGLACASSAAGQGPASARPTRAALLEVERSIMDASRYCAVNTVDASGWPQARTMDVFPPDDQMVVWFATNPKSRKVAQIQRNPRVTLYYFDPQSMGYVTLLGRARLVDDPAREKGALEGGVGGLLARPHPELPARGGDGCFR